ncbi:MAG TPA: hypothetical protein VGQ00_03600 [Candidatus Norongarragalinales archaeon]|jgi:hypothetical protein|nr:hypothetical protein [Candidatus Norongarragalinales archaeon]
MALAAHEKLAKKLSELGVQNDRTGLGLFTRNLTKHKLDYTESAHFKVPAPQIEKVKKLLETHLKNLGIEQESWISHQAPLGIMTHVVFQVGESSQKSLDEINKIIQALEKQNARAKPEFAKILRKIKSARKK